MPIRVTSIQRGCVYDGPGVRTTVFLKGCYLACPWCCNPETIYYDKDLFFIKNSDKCGSSLICNLCEIQGGTRAKANCPFGVYESTFRDWEVDLLYKEIVKDYTLFHESDGGITFSGGEPLYQAETLLPVLRLLKEAGIHVALESSLYAPAANFRLLKEFIDYWLVDLKFQFGFISYLEKDKYLYDFAENLKSLQVYQCNVKYRMVYPMQAKKNISDIISRLKKYNIEEIELLVCHNLGQNKYERLQKIPSSYSQPSDTELSLLTNELESKKIIYKLLKI